MAVDVDYGLSPEIEVRTIDAPPVSYLPPIPKNYSPKIGIIGTGGISDFHLKAYKVCGWDVVAMNNRTRSKAEERKDKFCHDAQVHDDDRQI